MLQIGHRIRAFRERFNLTREELGRRARLTPSAIAHLEAGRRAPTAETVLAIARALDVPVQDVFGTQPPGGPAGPIESKTLRVTARPPKVAFVVHEHDWDSFRDVVSFCSAIWGGAQNVIAPWEEDCGLRGIWRHIIRLHDPDFIVTCGDFPREFLSELRKTSRATISSSRGVLPFRETMLQTTTDFVPFALWPQPQRTPGPVYFAAGPDASTADPLPVTRLGCVYPEDEEALRAAGYEPRVCPHPAEPPAAWADYVQAQETSATILGLTRSCLDFTWVESPRGAKVAMVLGEEPSIRDACWAWTLAGLPAFDETHLTVYWCLVRQFEDPTARSELLASIRRRLRRNPHYEVAAHVYVVAPSVGRGVVQSVLEPHLKPTTDIGSRILFGSSKGRAHAIDDQTELTYCDGVIPLPTGFDEGCGRPRAVSVTLLDGEAEVALPLPAPLEIEEARAFWVVVDHPGLRYPRTRGLRGVISEHDCSATKSGMAAAFRKVGRDVVVPIRWPDPYEVLCTAFEDRGMKLALTDKAPYALALQGLFGSTQRSEVLRRRSVVRILRELAPVRPHSAAAKQALEALDAGDPAPAERILRLLSDGTAGRPAATVVALCQRTELPKADVLTALDALARCGGIEEGRELLCDRCRLTRWYPLDALQTGFRCAVCGTDNRPRVLGLSTTAEPATSYRAAQPLADALGQGALPVVQVMGKLAAQHGGELTVVPGLVVNALPESVELSRSRGGPIEITETRTYDLDPALRLMIGEGREVDIAGSLRGELVLGEVKTSGAQLAQREVDFCFALLREFGGGRGVFACLDEFASSTLDMIADRAKASGLRTPEEGDSPPFITWGFRDLTLDQ